MPKHILDNHLLEQKEEPSISNKELFKQIKPKLVVYFFLINIALYWGGFLIAYLINYQGDLLWIYMCAVPILPSGVLYGMLYYYFSSFFSEYLNRQSHEIPIHDKGLFNKVDFFIERVALSFLYAFFIGLPTFFLCGIIMSNYDWQLAKFLTNYPKYILFFPYLFYLNKVVKAEIKLLVKRMEEMQPSNP